MLNVSHVTKKYGKVTACNDLSFHLDPGSVTVLLGPNGAGKSTIMKSIIGFLRYDGQIRANVTREALERDGRTLEQLFFFWSLMGVTANCFLDVLPAVVVGTLVAGGNLLTALAWIPLIVSVNFFVTTVGAFIGLSVPVSAGKIVKQLVQILFIYFGLLPDNG